MADSAALGAAHDVQSEIEHRVGRNLLLYQRIENALKRLLLSSRIEGTPADAAARAQAWSAKVMRLNMGDAAKAVFEQVLTATPQELPAKHDSTEVWVRTSIAIGPPPQNPDAFERLAERCRAIVDQRNDLVHHFLRQWPLENDADARAALEALDAQHEAAAALRQELLPLLRMHEDFRESLADYAASPQWQRDLDVAMAQGSVIDVLADEAGKSRRSDGWQYETTALHRLDRSVASDVARLKEEWGKDWLTRTLAAVADLFEVADEPIPNSGGGARRRLYRLRPESKHPIGPE